MAEIINFPTGKKKKVIQKEIDEEKRMRAATKALREILQVGLPFAMLLYRKITEAEEKK